MNKIFYPLLFIVFILASCKTPQTEGGFTVHGTQLLDANKQPFVMRGINNPHAWHRERAIKSLDTMASLKTNCIRIVWDTAGSAQELEEIIKECIRLEMIPMVELHDATGDSLVTDILKLTDYYANPSIKNMLAKYNKYLLVNIANEWGNHGVTGTYWYESYRKAVHNMRKAGYHYTLVIDACGWGQNIEPILEFGQRLIDDDPKSNLLFSVHLYGSWNDSAKVENKIKKAHELNLPLIVGEFGYDYNGGNNNLTCRVNHKTIMRVCEEMSYGYLAWSWTGNNEENSWLDMASPSDWNTLTRWGKEVIYGKNGIEQTAKKANVFD